MVEIRTQPIDQRCSEPHNPSINSDSLECCEPRCNSKSGMLRRQVPPFTPPRSAVHCWRASSACAQTAVCTYAAFSASLHMCREYKRLQALKCSISHPVGHRFQLQPGSLRSQISASLGRRFQLQSVADFSFIRSQISGSLGSTSVLDFSFGSLATAPAWDSKYRGLRSSGFPRP